MEKYKISSELENKTLKRGDLLDIGRINYRVAQMFLDNLEECDNSVIFGVLSISDKYEFCEKIYGYTPEAGLFPETKYDDYKSLTKVALALMKLSEERGLSEEPKVYRSFEELNGQTLKYKDRVVFITGISKREYVVQTSLCAGGGLYLHDPLGEDIQIFKDLNISSVRGFANKIYGYYPDKGVFPRTHFGDYEALTKLTLELLKKCAENK